MVYPTTILSFSVCQICKKLPTGTGFCPSKVYPIIVGYKPMIFLNVGKTRINHPCGNGLYQLFISIYGDFGDGLWPCFAHIGSKIPVVFPLGFPESAGTARLSQAWSKM